MSNKKRTSARDRLLQHFLENTGRVMDSDELRKVAKITEWARRVRELRNDHGYQILTHNDRENLKPGQYLLEDPKPIPVFGKSVSKETRAYVLDRNGFTCQQCGAAAGEPHPDDNGRITRLHIGHIIDKSAGGSDDPSNLRALCSVCNEGARNLTLDRPSATKLLIQIRRATGADQLECLKWLISKYPVKAKEMLEDG